MRRYANLCWLLSLHYYQSHLWALLIAKEKPENISKDSFSFQESILECISGLWGESEEKALLRFCSDQAYEQPQAV